MNLTDSDRGCILKLQKIQPDDYRLQNIINRRVCWRSCSLNIVKHVDAKNDAMRAEDPKTHRISMINAVNQSGEIAISGKTPSKNVIPEDANNCESLLSTLKLPSHAKGKFFGSRWVYKWSKGD